MENVHKCGEHGRFEYCIDEIPGCVIGCHCHPGYYFDTDTKICEPSVKLTQNYRRRYNIEPMQTDIEYVTIGVTEPTPITNMDPINNQVDEITKTADDLGDWLYNQFFKTIENQVINNTKEAVDTRRSGVAPIKNLEAKRSSQKRNKKLKQKRRKSSLRRKLLRITEDDSAFDTSEERHSDSSDSSSSDESDASFEIEHKEDKHKDDKEHGHKKIVIINKKPRPPLPSFIFLPNMDTPFYPPIGLPPPPIMPMYPLVPVPPMPVFPCPEQDGSSPTRAPITTTKESTIEKATTQITGHETTAAELDTSERPITETTAQPATEAVATTQDPAKP
ncbi:proteoglycan 4-like [Pieris rapae]|uniref:proteoglycan 4-like n=1 Tax=Pieris rapae TaxID=64459 RepID=UPI001E27C3B4|nr:proteoglycan 4-like [Pieris rapae]